MQVLNVYDRKRRVVLERSSQVLSEPINQKINIKNHFFYQNLTLLR